MGTQPSFISNQKNKDFLLKTAFYLFFFFFFFFAISWTAPAAYGGSQARGQIEATSAGLYHSHSNVGSEPHLQPTPQLVAMLDPQPTKRGQVSNLHLHRYWSDLFLLRHHGNSSHHLFKTEIPCVSSHSSTPWAVSTASLYLYNSRYIVLYKMCDYLSATQNA